MIKLTDILNEARVVPVVMGNRRKMFDTLNNTYKKIFETIIQKDSLDELLSDIYNMEGAPVTLEDIEYYLIDEWGFNEDSKETSEVAKYIEQYYKNIESGDIKITGAGKTSVSGYSYVETICVSREYEHHDGEECYTILTKF
jgi:hypothetical protein